MKLPNKINGTHLLDKTGSRWWVDDLSSKVFTIDSAHAVYATMRGRIGELISFRSGVVDHLACKLKMNARS